jgi:hypothetical protein
MTKLFTPNRHTGGGRYPDAFEIPGFRVALAIASLPGMTIELCRELLRQDTRSDLAHAMIDRSGRTVWMALFTLRFSSGPVGFYRARSSAT